MEEYKLTRVLYDAQGTFGQLRDSNNSLLCLTCELTWNNNESGQSCIPKGSYNVIPHNSALHPDTWEIAGVPERSGILIHDGNTEIDSRGCILVGNEMGEINGLPAVLNSRATLALLRGILPQTFHITIA